MNKVVCIVGMCGSGKSVVADEFVKLGYGYVRFGQITLDIIKEKSLEINEENERKIREELRNEHGMAAFAKLNLPKIEKLLKSGNVVADGLYSWTEYKILKEHFREKMEVIAVLTPPEVRYNRLKNRPLDTEGKNRPLPIEAAKQRDYSEIENIEKGGPIAMANHYVLNTGTIEELNQKLNQSFTDSNKKSGSARPSWDEYFMGITKEVAQRATCDRGKSGCIIVRDKRILCTGYVGSAAGTAHCDDVGHLMKIVVHEHGKESKHCVRTIHAEQNAICQAAREGISLKGATVYCKMEPCAVCAKMIINCGISRVVCEKRYHVAQESRELFKQTGIKLEVLNDEIEQYTNQ